MDDTLAQAYTLVRVVVLAAVVVLALLSVLLARRPRRLTPAVSIIRALVALAGFVGVLVLSGASIDWLWGAGAVVVGAAAGYVRGRTSKTSQGGEGSTTIRRSPVPVLVLAAGYVLAAFTLLYGTVGLFSVALLVVLLGTAMVVGASAAETAMSGAASQPRATQADATKGSEPA